MNQVKRTIHRGQEFEATSHGVPSHWTVTARIKTADRNEVYTKCVDSEQTRKYTGKQFGMLIRMGIVKLVHA